jgi:hypothetical protein
MSVLSQFGGGAIKSIQRGVNSIGFVGALADITVSAVDVSKSKLTLLGHCPAGTTAAGATSFEAGFTPTITLVNSTTIRPARYYDGGGNCTVSWELTEYY